MADPLLLTEQTLAAIIAHALQQKPVEACGYLAAGDDTVVRHHFPLTNLDHSGEHFTMDPAEQFATLRCCREQGLVLRAVYHSHPQTPARPSAEDIRLAFDPDLSYVIVSLAREVPEVRAFRIRDGHVTPEPIDVVPDQPTNR